MFTVLIYDQKTAAFLEESKSFYSPFLEAGSFALCSWNIEGKTIDRALPELYDIVREEENWRAVVLTHTFSEPETNPFDFFTGEESGETIESQPLIRLTHMLSEVARDLKVTYDPEVAECDRKYVMTDHTKAYRTPYVLECHKPRQIILIATRKRDVEAAQADKPSRIKEVRYDFQSSQFWNRNEYPKNVRFLVYDFATLHDVIFKKDIYNFGFAVLTLLLNEIEPSSLVAYRLYRLGVTIDENKMREILSDFYGKQLMIQTLINRFGELFGDKDSANPVQTLPNMEEIYLAEFPADSLDKLMANLRGYGLASDCPVSEIDRWRREINEIRHNQDEFLKMPKRYLKKSLLKIRESEQGDILDKALYTEEQMEDLREQMESLEQEMFSLEIANQYDFNYLTGKKEQCEQEVAEEINTRLSRNHLLFMGGAGLLVYFAGFSVFLFRAFGDTPALVSGLLVALGSTGVLALGGIGYLLIQRGQLRKKIKMCNTVMNIIAGLLRNNQEKYSQYLTKAFNYMKYWKIVEKRKNEQYSNTNIRYYLKNHAASVNRALLLCEKLKMVYQLSINVDYDRYDWRQFHLESNAKDSGYYEIGIEKETNQIPYNETGTKLYSPYGFISHLYIEREEAFDD